MKETKKFILIERDQDRKGPYIVEEDGEPVFFTNFLEAKEWGDLHLIDPAIVNMY